MKKNSAKRKLIPAAAMLCISAAMLATSTYAWFTMNKEVSVTSMQVMAQAEAGLLVSEANSTGPAGWDNVATFNVSGQEPIQLFPASTLNSLEWWHAMSNIPTDGAGITSGSARSVNLSGDYEDISSIATASIGTATANSTAAGTIHYQDNDNSNEYENGEGYYMQYTYYLKSSGTSALSLGNTTGNQNLQILVPAITTTTGSANLDKALRVGVKLNDRFYIFAPVGGYDDTYYVTTNAAGTSNTAATVYPANSKVATDLESLNAVSGTGTQVDVYVWFEGEDDNCKSENLTATLNQLDVSVKFSLEDLSGDATVGGVAAISN